MPAIFIITWKTLEGSEALNRLLKVLIVAINAQCYSVDAPPLPPGLGWRSLVLVVRVSVRVRIRVELQRLGQSQL